MPVTEYHFFTNWRIPQTTIEEVYDILTDPVALARWWPSVYLDVQERAPGAPDRLGLTVAVYSKGWLPYTLLWESQIAEVVRPTYMRLVATGDFIGRGIWTLQQDGPDAKVTYDWKVSVGKPLLRMWSPLLKPAFEANHHWAMQKGEESLILEIARRHAVDADARALIPPPPPPTTTSPVPLMLGGLAAVAGLALAARVALKLLRSPVVVVGLIAGVGYWWSQRDSAAR